MMCLSIIWPIMAQIDRSMRSQASLFVGRMTECLYFHQYAEFFDHAEAVFLSSPHDADGRIPRKLADEILVSTRLHVQRYLYVHDLRVCARVRVCVCVWVGGWVGGCVCMCMCVCLTLFFSGRFDLFFLQSGHLINRDLSYQNAITRAHNCCAALSRLNISFTCHIS